MRTKASKLTANTPIEDPDPKKTAADSKGATRVVDNDALAMEISQYAAEWISAMMEKFQQPLWTILQLDWSATRSESHTSEGEDNTATVESRWKCLETKVCTQAERSVNMEGRSCQDNILIFNLKENIAVSQWHFLRNGCLHCWAWSPSTALLKLSKHTDPSASRTPAPGGGHQAAYPEGQDEDLGHYSVLQPRGEKVTLFTHQRMRLPTWTIWAELEVMEVKMHVSFSL